MRKNKLQIQHLSKKIKAFDNVRKISMPPSGWIRAVRTALGMSMQQLGNKLSITKQSVQDMERREREGTISLKALKEAAHALDMQLIYGFVPKNGSIEDLIELKARELAIQIVLRTSNSMKLEDQENSKKRIQKAIQERTNEIVNEMPKILWD